MITATRRMTLFNTYTDKDSRRELYYPTNFEDVSFYEIDSASFNNGIRTEGLDFKIRIPHRAAIEGGREYIHEARYRTLTAGELSGYWTLQKGSIILMADPCIEEGWLADYALEKALTRQELQEIAGKAPYVSQIINVKEYADDTLRGSERVRHWRIGGA